MKVDLIETGIGNIGSVKRCLQRLNVDVRVVNQFSHPDGTRPLVLPGVGQFGAIMQALQQNKLDVCLRNLIIGGTPYLGICVGMQILFDGSEESDETPGLSLLKGKVLRFQNGKIPQIGWNLITSVNDAVRQAPQYGYFVNSYYAKPQSSAIVSHVANYYGEFCAAVRSDNITAVQFHPEKSAQFGQEFLKEWLHYVN